MIEELEINIPKLLSVIFIIIFGSFFDNILTLSNSNKVFVSQIAKLIIGLVCVYVTYPLIKKVPEEFFEIVILGIAINSAWIVSYFRDKFKQNTKSKIDRKLNIEEK